MWLRQTWLDIFTRYVIPPLLGGAGGIITIYGQWGIEKRRQKLQARREIVSEWRKTLIPLLIAKPETSVGGSASKHTFMDHESYASLRPHLKPELVRKLESSTIHVVLGGPPFPRNEIIEEIARIEREWQLI